MSIPSISAAVNSDTIDLVLEKELSSLEDKMAKAVAEAILKQPISKRDSYYKYNISARVSSDILKKVTSLFSIYLPPRSNRNFFLTQEELKTLDPEQIKSIRNLSEFSRGPNYYPRAYLCVQGADFAFSSQVINFDDPKQLIPDLTIKIGDKQFRVNSYLLNRECEFFKALMQSGMQEQATREIDLTNAISEETFVIFMRYLYDHINLQLTTAEFEALAECGSFFQVPKMEHFLLQYNFQRELQQIPLPNMLDLAIRLSKKAPHTKTTTANLLPRIAGEISRCLTRSCFFPFHPTEAQFKAIVLPELDIISGAIIRSYWNKLQYMRTKGLYFIKASGLEAVDGKVISTMEIHRLSFIECSFLSDQFLQNASSVKGLQSLSLSRTPWIDLNVLKSFVEKTELKTLYFSPQRPISSEEIQVLFDIKTLQKIELSQSDCAQFDARGVTAEAEKHGITFKWLRVLKE